MIKTVKTMLQTTVILFGLTVSLVYTPINAQAGTTPNSANAKILVVGDSLSAAYGIDIEQGWVTLLQQRLNKNNMNYHVVNASISGETSGGGLARLPALLKQHQPDIVLLELGANDGLRGYPVNILKENLATLVELSQQAEAQVLLIGIQIPHNYGARYNALFESVFIHISEHYQLIRVPTLLGDVPLNPSLIQEDRLHPNALAQPYLLDHVWPYLLKLIHPQTEHEENTL